jgi:hypothetical protein
VQFHVAHSSRVARERAQIRAVKAMLERLSEPFLL